MKILVVEPDSESLATLTTLLKSRGYRVFTARDGDQAMEVFQRARPDVVFCELSAPRLDALGLLERIRDHCTETIFVITTARSSEESALEALRLRANEYLLKPLSAARLLPILRKFEGVVHGREIAAQIAGRLIAQHSTLIVDNRLDLVPGIAEFLIHHSFLVGPTAEVVGLKLGLVELLNNAIEHGNLGISAAEKEAALASEEGYTALYQARVADPVLAARRVTITSEADREGCTWTITDEGAGWDWRRFLDGLAAPNVLQLSGRGVFLSRFQFDWLEYIDTGSTVRARKNYQPLPEDLE